MMLKKKKKKFLLLAALHANDSQPTARDTVDLLYRNRHIHKQYFRNRIMKKKEDFFLFFFAVCVSL